MVLWCPNMLCRVASRRVASRRVASRRGKRRSIGNHYIAGQLSKNTQKLMLKGVARVHMLGVLTSSMR